MSDSHPLAAGKSTLIDPVRLAACLGGMACRLDVDAVAECESTNALLMSRRDSLWSQKKSANATSVSSGSVLVADRQTAGRGRRGRRWLSAQQRPEDSLTFSLLWRFDRGADLSGLSLAIGVALTRAMAEFGATGLQLKWPNDLLCRTPAGLAKLGGILIELASDRIGTAAVIGIGLNLRSPIEAVPDQAAAGLDSLQVGGFPERHRLLSTLLTQLVIVLDAFSGQGFLPLRDEWERANAYAGQMVRLLDENRPDIVGRCLGVDVDGALRVETSAGVCRWLAGDVSLRAATGEV